MLEKTIEQQGLLFNSYAEATEVQKILLENEYCTMISKEDDLWLLNWVWSPCANRRGVIFIDSDHFDDEWYKFTERHPEIDWEKEDK